MPVSIRLTTHAQMLNMYEICLNTTNYLIFNMQDFRYWLCTFMLDCFGHVWLLFHILSVWSYHPTLTKPHQYLLPWTVYNTVTPLEDAVDLNDNIYSWTAWEYHMGCHGYDQSIFNIKVDMTTFEGFHSKNRAIGHGGIFKLMFCCLL